MSIGGCIHERALAILRTAQHSTDTDRQRKKAQRQTANLDEENESDRKEGLLNSQQNQKYGINFDKEKDKSRVVTRKREITRAVTRKREITRAVTRKRAVDEYLVLGF